MPRRPLELGAEAFDDLWGGGRVVLREGEVELATHSVEVVVRRVRGIRHQRSRVDAGSRHELIAERRSGAEGESRSQLRGARKRSKIPGTVQSLLSAAGCGEPGATRRRHKNDGRDARTWQAHRGVNVGVTV